MHGSNDTVANILEYSGVVNILQSTENHVSELRKLSDQQKQDKNREENNTVPVIPKFSVVFGKVSSKKHKTYDEDGVIELKNSYIVLKNDTGKCVGTTSRTKDIQEGTVIMIAGNEVLVGAPINVQESSLSFKKSSPIVPHLTKKSSSSPSFKPPLANTSTLNVENKKTGVKRKFNVVWAPLSNKKHKTWEGDGVLEIEGKIARLRDERGKLLATEFNLKSEVIAEGDRLTMEGKEIEVTETFDSKSTDVQVHSKITKPNRRTLPPFKPPDILPDTPKPEHNTPLWSEDSYEQRNIRLPSTPPPSDNFLITGNTPGSFYEPTSDVDCDVKEAEEPVSSSLVSQLHLPTEYEFVLPTPPFDHQYKHGNGKRVVKVTVPDFLAAQLRPHQRQGLQFLYESVLGFNTINNIDCYGAILADEMGLGKTLQCITLIYTLLRQSPYGGCEVKRVLIVTPSSLVDNWKQEVNKWLEHERIFTFEVSTKNRPYQFAQSRHIPIMIISYEMYARVHEEIEEIDFQLMICDEGHRLKNNTIKVSQLLEQNQCKRRILLTGTPIQNDLQEFFMLINFVNPGVLGSYQEFKVRYETPIVQSQQSCILPQYKTLGDQRSSELARITNHFFLRRTQEVNRMYLPKKQEVVVFCRPSILQKQIYGQVLNAYKKNKEVTPLHLITVLKKICSYPALLNETGDAGPVSFKSFLPPLHRIQTFDSTKLEMVFCLLEDLRRRREKIVLVSYFNKTLDLLKEICLRGHFPFQRLDGTTPAGDRAKIVKTFNDPQSDSLVFLLSAKAGGAGLNLIGANRLVLFDNDWNPATDLQAMSRIWRDGQKKPVYIYRLITSGTIEEKIFQRQVSKTSLGGRVMDQSKSKLQFTDEELRDLFTHPGDFDCCLTHDNLKCSCDGHGSVPESSSQDDTQPSDNNSDTDEGAFKLRTTKPKKKQKKNLQMHELMKYEHHNYPIADSVLKELCLQKVQDKITFIFRTQVQGQADMTENKLEDVKKSTWSSFLDEENELGNIFT